MQSQRKRSKRAMPGRQLRGLCEEKPIPNVRSGCDSRAGSARFGYLRTGFEVDQIPDNPCGSRLDRPISNLPIRRTDLPGPLDVLQRIERP